MTDSELLPIGAFARLVGLTATALRFYDDAGILHPELVDAQTGYRFYSVAQAAAAQRLRELREIGMPLSDITRFFAADTAESLRLLNEHMSRVSAETARVRHAAACLVASLQTEESSVTLCSLPGPALAAAVDQVLATTVPDPDFPVLNGVRLILEPDALILAATDRYRFTTRTLVPNRTEGASWAGTISGDALRNSVSSIRRSSTISLSTSDDLLNLRFDDGEVDHCGLIAEPFPDVRGFIESLPTAAHRSFVEQRQLLRVMEEQPLKKIGLRFTPGGLQALLPNRTVDLDGTTTGPELTLWFELTTLHPAVTHALGNDLVLDIVASDQPVVLRSADDGDFTTVLMPCKAPGL